MKKLILHNISRGFHHNMWKYVCIAIVIIIVAIRCTSGMVYYAELLSISARPTAGDVFTALFQGRLPFFNGIDSFEIPFEWLLLHLAFFLLISNSISGDLERTGVQTILQSHGRGKWIFCKYIDALFMTLVFVIFALIVSACTAVFMGGSADMNTGGFLTILIPQVSTDYRSVVDIYLLPTLSLFTMAVMLLTAEIIINSVIAYFVLLAVSVASIYSAVCFLPGNGTMLLRSTVLSQEGIGAASIYIADLVYIVGFVLLGWQLFRKKDLI